METASNLVTISPGSSARDFFEFMYHYTALSEEKTQLRAGDPSCSIPELAPLSHPFCPPLQGEGICLPRTKTRL